MTDEPTKPEKDRKLPKRTETWAEDQQDRGYYYDDSTGYEIYEPDDEEAGEDVDDGSKPSA